MQTRKGLDASGIAAYLQERRSVLDRTLRQEDHSGISAVLRRVVPAPTALVAIHDAQIGARFVRLLGNANLDIEHAGSTAEGLEAIAEDTHAVVFTDRLDLIRAIRQLPAGAATHAVFVGTPETFASAWQAGANDCIPDKPGGESFWAHITTARRIVSLAGALQLAVTDNRTLSTVDGLTGCGSRRFFEEQFPREVERAIRLDRPISLVMCDIDYFKRVNDQYGHLVGDDVLRTVGDRLSRGLRLGMDWLARFGGEEFAVVLPESSHAEAASIAERLRVLVCASPFRTRIRFPILVTASFGVSGLTGRDVTSPDPMAALIKRADSALYASKHAGRNRVTCSQAD